MIFDKKNCVFEIDLKKVYQTIDLVLDDDYEKRVDSFLSSDDCHSLHPKKINIYEEVEHFLYIQQIHLEEDEIDQIMETFEYFYKNESLYKNQDESYFHLSAALACFALKIKIEGITIKELLDLF
jgi:transposase